MAAADARDLIATAARNFLAEVPALAPMKLVVGVSLRGRGDIQHFRLELPEITVSMEVPADARVQVEMPRAFFNVKAREAKGPDWIEAFTYGQAKATGPSQILKLIVNVVERHEERAHSRRARTQS